MVQEIVVWCSPCYDEDTREPGRPVVVALDGQNAQTIDMCETHEKQFMQPLRELTAAFGQAIHDDGLTCIVCGKRYTKPESLRKHVVRLHGGASHDVSPASTPSPPPPRRAVEKVYECPDCDRKFETPQGAGAHRSRAHGYVSEKSK